MRTHVLSLRLYTSSSYPRFNRDMRDKVRPHPFAMSVYYLDQGLKKLRAVAAELDPAVSSAPPPPLTLPLPSPTRTAPPPAPPSLLFPPAGPLVPRARTLAPVSARPASSGWCDPSSLARRARAQGFTEVQELWRGMQDLSIDQDEFMRIGGTELAPMSTSASKSVAFKYAASRFPLIFKYTPRAMQKGCSIRVRSPHHHTYTTRQRSARPAPSRPAPDVARRSACDSASSANLLLTRAFQKPLPSPPLPRPTFPPLHAPLSPSPSHATRPPPPHTRHRPPHSRCRRSSSRSTRRRRRCSTRRSPSCSPSGSTRSRATRSSS